MIIKELRDCELKKIEAYNAIAAEMNRANAAKKEELATRDRVDISLKEYMNLINERDMLISKLAFYEETWAGFELDPRIEIIPGSVTFTHCDDPCMMKRRYGLTFDTDLCQIRRLGL